MILEKDMILHELGFLGSQGRIMSAVVEIAICHMLSLLYIWSVRFQLRSRLQLKIDQDLIFSPYFKAKKHSFFYL
jgi:hypothetical protein